MAVKYLDKYKASSSAKTGGVHSEGLFHIWTPDKNKTEYNQLIAQGKAEYEKDFESTDELRAFLKTLLVGVKTNGSAPAKVTDSMIDEASEDTLYALIANASHDRYRTGKGDGTGSFFDKLHGGWVKAVRKGITEFKEFKKVVKALEAKNLSENQINQFLSSNKVAGADAEQLTEYAEEIPEYTAADFAGKNGFGVTEDLDENGEPQGLDISEAAAAVGSADTVAETVDEQITEAVVGNSSLDALKKEEGFREEDGRYFVGDQEYTYDEKNDQVVFVGGENNGDRWTPEGSGMASQYEQLTEQEKQTIAQQQGIVDEIVGTDEVDPVTGEKVTPGLVNEYGDFVDQTLTDIDADENDFAKQINAQLNQFLIGKDADGNDILDDEGNPIKGFLDYQSDLEDAAKTYKTDMTDLSGLYDTAYKDYEDDLDPLRSEIGRIRGRLGDVADQQMDVARDAGDESYYSRLSDLYYQDAKDQLDASAAGARETLNETYANAGLDPNSPAYTAAIMDLQKSRGDAMRSARRQSLLDSYGLGSQMLSNRTTALSGAGNALGNEMAGVQTEMGALDSLYGVKLQGLNTRRDMIGQIYGADKDIAATGISGLNTVLGTNLKGIDANQNQFNTKINLSNDLYKNKAGMFGTAFDALGGMRGIYDKEGEDRFNTLTEFNLGQGSNKLTLETLRQYASENPNYTIDPDLEKFLSGGK